tara:strand:+ start:2894 stop:3055 length:162 start_codon:yes stop_codon:yes gene_type:complete
VAVEVNWRALEEAHVTPTVRRVLLVASLIGVNLLPLVVVEVLCFLLLTGAVEV